ncbi:hypothetical protein [Lyngbya confervoides]|uniref:Uncharacterized protein n=1 Tax=Lyngbya confervoides BDU141951 TaxID=1574623 RepID=A0ABD4T957_9CYAN|nr:hypothetical protein [Lyngbya confervoides]MCM1985049.1 hypothetical protein [Lyngbya confervoides BDU141951]
MNYVKPLIKIALISLAIALGIQWVGPLLPLSQTPAVALGIVLLPSLGLAFYLWFRRG